MGIVVNPQKAFRVCHGYKIDHELILWSEGVIGTLSDEQEALCKMIVLENAKGGRAVFFSREEALKADAEPITPKTGQFIAIRTCAHLLDVAEDKGLIKGIPDVWTFMDYCMAKLGYGKVDREVPDYIRKFIDEMLAKEEMYKGMTKLEKLQKIYETHQHPAEHP